MQRRVFLSLSKEAIIMIFLFLVCPHKESSSINLATNSLDRLGINACVTHNGDAII